MLVTRSSIISGITRTMDLNITPAQIIDYENGMLVQDAFPNLNSSEREFFMTGITDDEWDNTFTEYDYTDDEYEEEDEKEDS